MMNRRELSVGASCVLGAAALGGPATLLAQVKKPEDGVEYYTLKQPLPAFEAADNKIEVIDFFWYNCPHCNAFAPQLAAWMRRMAPDVVLRHVPVGFRDDMVPQQRLFYTLEALGKVEELHGKVFEAIHRQNAELRREATIVPWAAKQGLDPEKFRELYNSFTVSSKTRRATQLQDMYKVEGVPALGVAGRYYTDGSMASNMPRALQVVDYLISEVRKR